MKAEISDGITTKTADVSSTYFDADVNYSYCYIDGTAFYFDYFKYL